jgi:hypothetical protein
VVARSVAELRCHLQSSSPYGIRFSHKTYRPSPIKDVTWKNPLLEGTAYKYNYRGVYCRLLEPCTSQVLEDEAAVEASSRDHCLLIKGCHSRDIRARCVGLLTK